MRLLLRTAAVLGLLAWAGEGVAQEAPRDYPNRPVKIVVPFAAGGPTDIMARLLAQKLSDSTGKNFYVENQPGAGSNIGVGQVMRSAPDGHTLLIISSSLVVNPVLYEKPPFDPLKDLVPVTLAATSPQAMIVSGTLPVKSVRELIDYYKANPDKRNFGSPGTGTTGHLSSELFRISTGLDLVHVPYGGAGPVLSAVLGGHATMAFTAIPPAAGQIKNGSLRALAVSSAKRSAAFPQIPTMNEAGFPGQESEVMQGILAPAGTPKPIVDYLQREIKRIIALPDVKERIDTLGFEPNGNTPQEFETLIKSELAKYGRIIRDAGIKKLQ